MIMNDIIMIYRLLQKPEALTIFCRSDRLNCIYLWIKFIIPAFAGHCTPADSVPGHFQTEFIYHQLPELNI